MRRLIVAVKLLISAQKHMHRPYSFRVCWLKAGDLTGPSVYDEPRAPWVSVSALVAGCLVAGLIAWRLA